MPGLIVTSAIVLVVLLFLAFNYQRTKAEIEGFSLQYYKCPKYANTSVMENFFKKHQITRSQDKNVWDIYIPCGYNYVENELPKVRPSRVNQLIFGIKGCDHIVSKNGLWDLLNKAYGRNVASRLMPESFILHEPMDMEIFATNYNPNKIYFVKEEYPEETGNITHP